MDTGAKVKAMKELDFSLKRLVAARCSVTSPVCLVVDDLLRNPNEAEYTQAYVDYVVVLVDRDKINFLEKSMNLANL